MVNLFNLVPKINKQRIFKKLHIAEGTETYKNASSFFDEICKIIAEKMKITAAFAETDVLNLGVSELDNCKKHVICFVSSNYNISETSNNMMSSGMYMKGYLLHEIAEDALFCASNEMNKIIRSNEGTSGYKLTRRYAAGDGIIDFNKQQEILDALKKEVAVDACLNESQALIPEMSILYLFGLIKKNMSGSISGNEDEKCSECSLCQNINCSYREENNEKI